MSKNSTLSSGLPLEDPSYDKLGYASFAKTLANAIMNMTPPNGLVIAIYGTWGSGKTTMLKFIEHYLQHPEKPTDLIIIHFNPWWFSGAEALTLHFFEELQAVLGNARFEKQLLTDLASLAEAVSGSTPYAPAGQFVAWILRKAGKQTKDALQLKRDVAEALGRQNQKILLIVDDVDRLTSDEIRQLFRAIKAVADFPNVVYLLAFDQNVVVNALKDVQGSSGQAYLEKIVQVPFELPLPERNSVYRLFLAELDLILEGTPIEMFDQARWSELFRDGVDHFISTPRDVVRLTNTLRVTYPAVRGEVNGVDFVAIETLRVFCPIAYDVVRKNVGAFTGHRLLVGGPVGKESLRDFHESWMKNIQQEDVPAVKILFAHLFPKFQSAWENIDYSASSELTWRKELRVCSLATFPVYFRFALPEGEVSLAEVRAVLSIADNREAFGSKLLDFAGQKRPDGKSRVSALLDRLADYPEGFNPESIPSVVQTLFEIGDRLLLPEDDSHDLLGLRNFMRISRLLRHLLQSLDEEQRYGVLRQSIENGYSVATIVDFVIALENQHGKHGTQPLLEDERLVTSEHLSELERLALKKIRDTAKAGDLLGAPRLSMILDYWHEWDVNEVRAWIDSLVKNKDALPPLIYKFLHTYRESISDKPEKLGNN